MEVTFRKHQQTVMSSTCAPCLGQEAGSTENPSPSVGPKLHWTQVCDRLSQTLLALPRQMGGQKMCKVFISSAVTLSFGHCPQTHRSPFSYSGFSHVFLPTTHKAGSGLCNPPPRISHPASCLALTVITKDADNWLVYPCFLSGSPQTGISTLGSPSCP